MRCCRPNTAFCIALVTIGLLAIVITLPKKSDCRVSKLERRFVHTTHRVDCMDAGCVSERPCILYERGALNATGVRFCCGNTLNQVCKLYNGPVLHYEGAYSCGSSVHDETRNQVCPLQEPINCKYRERGYVWEFIILPNHHIKLGYPDASLIAEILGVAVCFFSIVAYNDPDSYRLL